MSLYLVGGFARSIATDLSMNYSDIDLLAVNEGVSEFEDHYDVKLSSISSTKNSYGFDKYGKEFDITFISRDEFDIEINDKLTDYQYNDIDVVNHYLKHKTDITVNGLGYPINDLSEVVGLISKNNDRGKLIKALRKKIINVDTGLSDIETRTIRVHSKVSMYNVFTESPARLFRICRLMANDPTYRPTKRMKEYLICHFEKYQRFNVINPSFYSEFKKVADLKKPSIFFRALLDLRLLKVFFPFLYDMHVTKNNSSVYHLEDNVFEHTMMMLDYAAENHILNKTSMKFILVHDCLKYSSKKEFGRFHRHLSPEIFQEYLNYEVYPYILESTQNNDKIIKVLESVIKHHHLWESPVKSSLIKAYLSSDLLTKYRSEFTTLLESDYYGKKNTLFTFRKYRKFINKFIDDILIFKDLKGLVNYENKSYCLDRIYGEVSYFQGISKQDKGLIFQYKGQDFYIISIILGGSRIKGLETPQSDNDYYVHYAPCDIMNPMSSKLIDNNITKEDMLKHSNFFSVLESNGIHLDCDDEKLNMVLLSNFIESLFYKSANNELFSIYANNQGLNKVNNLIYKTRIWSFIQIFKKEVPQEKILLMLNGVSNRDAKNFDKRYECEKHDKSYRKKLASLYTYRCMYLMYLDSRKWNPLIDHEDREIVKAIKMDEPLSFEQEERFEKTNELFEVKKLTKTRKGGSDPRVGEFRNMGKFTNRLITLVNKILYM